MALTFKVTIVDTLFTTIPANTKVADYVLEGAVNPAYTIYSSEYDINSQEKYVYVKADMDATNLKPFHFSITDRPSGETVDSGTLYPKVQAKDQNKFSKPNMIYKITRDINLNNCILTIPTGCTLDFQGGSFSNGTINFNSAQIIAGDIKIFSNITFGNSPNCRLNVCWFGALGNYTIDNTSYFNETFSKKLPVYIPRGTFKVNGTVTVNSSIYCEGAIRSEPSTPNTVIFDVVDNGFPLNSSSKLIIDGLHITEVGTKWTSTAISVARTDTTIQNCYVLAFDFGIRLRTYCTYITNSTVRTCNVNIDVSATDNTRQTCNVAIIGCTSAHARDLSLSIGAFRPDIVGAGDYYSGFGILVSGCSFDEGTIEIAKVHTVGIRDCYFERATSRDIAIAINLNSQLSHNITIDDCTFINFKYGIKVWLKCDNLTISNCNFKAIKRYAIALKLSLNNSLVDISSCNFESDVNRDIFYAYYNWSGEYNEMSLTKFSYDRWYMNRGVQFLPTIASGIPLGINTLISNSKASDKSIGTTALRYGNVYYTSLITNAVATYTLNKLTFTKDEDYTKLTIGDVLVVKGGHLLVIDLDLDNNIATIQNMSSVPLTIGESVTVNQEVASILYYQPIKAGTTRPTIPTPTGCQFFDTTLKKPIWWNGANWIDATGTIV